MRLICLYKEAGEAAREASLAGESASFTAATVSGRFLAHEQAASVRSLQGTY